MRARLSRGKRACTTHALSVMNDDTMMKPRALSAVVLLVIGSVMATACADSTAIPPPVGPSTGASVGGPSAPTPSPPSLPLPASPAASASPTAPVTPPEPAAPQAPPRAVTPPESFVRLDGEIRRAFEPSKKHTYRGTVEDVLGTSSTKGRYPANAEEAEQWDKALEALVSGNKPDWAPVVFARQGAVFDVLRDGLDRTQLASLTYFTPSQERQLKALENSGRPELSDRAAELRDQVKTGADQKRARALDAASTQMVRRYASAVALAQKTNVRHPLVDQAIARLAHYTGILGEARMREYVTSTPDPSDPYKKLTYTAGQYEQMRRP